MPVVSNTSPILNLAIIHRLELLRGQFPQVCIPPAVRDELFVGNEFPEIRIIQQALQDQWLRVEEVKMCISSLHSCSN